MINKNDFEKELKKDLKNCEMSIIRKDGETSIRIIGTNHTVEFLFLELFDKLKQNLPNEVYNKLKHLIITWLTSN